MPSLAKRHQALIHLVVTYIYFLEMHTLKELEDSTSKYCQTISTIVCSSGCLWSETLITPLKNVIWSARMRGGWSNECNNVTNCAIGAGKWICAVQSGSHRCDRQCEGWILSLIMLNSDVLCELGEGFWIAGWWTQQFFFWVLCPLSTGAQTTRGILLKSQNYS